MEGGDGVGDGRAPVLAGDAELVEAQVGGQFGDVTGHRGGVVAGQGALGAAGASVVDRDDGVVRGQQRHDVAPVRHGLRHAVQQEHRLAGAADRVVDLHAVDLGLAVCEPDSGVVSEVHLGELLALWPCRRRPGGGSSGAAFLHPHLVRIGSVELVMSLRARASAPGAGWR